MNRVKFNRIVSVMIILSMIVPILAFPVFADNVYESELSQLDSKVLFESLTPEAKNVFLKSIVEDSLSGRPELLEYHEQKVGTVGFSVKASVYYDNAMGSMKAFSSSTFAPSAMRAAAMSDAMTVGEAMKVFGSEIAVIGLPIAAEYALKAIAASIFVALADGAFVAGDIIAIVMDSGAALVLVFCADEIWRNRYKIQRAFGNLVENAGDALGNKVDDARDAVEDALNWLFAETKSKSESGKTEGKISSGAERDVKKKLGSKALDKFKKALKKGLVGKTGQEGIKKLVVVVLK